MQRQSKKIPKNRRIDAHKISKLRAVFILLVSRDVERDQLSKYRKRMGRRSLTYQEIRSSRGREGNDVHNGTVSREWKA